MKKANLFTWLILPLTIAGAGILTGCENDLKDLQKISAAEVNKPVTSYTNVDVIYSDSAKVKAHMTAPLMMDYDSVKQPYTEMPKGVKVIFYGPDLNETGTITAKYAVYHKQEKNIVLRNNVVGTNVKGETFTSDELIWDQNSKQVTSNTLVHVRMADGTALDGSSFSSDEGLNHWKFGNAHGDINVKSQDIPKQ
ncbi:MAG: LPS export ABC transporter periplasmic protein LptC [Bacteroidetes bacterium]|nr:LPS export ABC transporter periplasmic protein LptC [Bacteroidota bacterium]